MVLLKVEYERGDSGVETESLQGEFHFLVGQLRTGELPCFRADEAGWAVVEAAR